MFPSTKFNFKSDQKPNHDEIDFSDTTPRPEGVVASLDPIQKLTKDLMQAARTLHDDEARFLVDYYYIAQEDRKRSGNQVQALGSGDEPNSVIKWLHDQSSGLEKQIQKALDSYTQAHPMGAWMREIFGIGPVISAGLLANIDIEKAPTAGHIWRFAGLDPTVVWKKTEEVKKDVAALDVLDEVNVRMLASRYGRNPESLLNRAKDERGKLSKSELVKALSMRPWNASLKTLCCHPDTMVTTDKGAVLISEIKEGDKVLTHRGRFRPVKSVHRTEHEGALVALRTYGNTALPLLVTDNHPIYTELRLSWKAKKGRDVASFGAQDRKLRSGSLPDEQVRVMREQRANGAKLKDLAALYGCSESSVSMICNERTRKKSMQNERMWVRADGVLPGWLISSPRLQTGEEQVIEVPSVARQRQSLPSKIRVDVEMARLLGLFLAEGHVSGNQTGFSFHREEVEYQQFVIDVLQRRLGLRVQSPSVNGNSWQVLIGSKQLASLMTDVCGTNSFDMRVPKAVWAGPAEVRAAFLRGWFEGDGHITSDEAALTCSSKAAVHEAHALLVSLGVAATISPYQRSYKVGVSSLYEFDQVVFSGALGVEDSRRSALCRAEEDAVWTQVRESSAVLHSGFVYNLEVEEDESYTANGVAVHNCWKVGQSFMKFSGKDECAYGKIYLQRKAFEIERNEAGGNKEAAEKGAGRVGKTTDAFGHYSAGRLPPAQIDARARRYAVKLFLSHLHGAWYEKHFGTPAPLPYPIAILGHAHLITPETMKKGARQCN